MPGRGRTQADAASRGDRPRTSTSKGKGAPKVTANGKASVRSATPTLLTGGNPQIAKADGDAPVQAYIAALPGWKRDMGVRLDALIVGAVPNVRKAVKWNSPFYGIEGQGWFLGIHAFTDSLKLAFFQGASLRPIPPVPSKSEDTRYLKIYENDALDEKQLAAWFEQAAALPGWLKERPRRSPSPTAKQRRVRDTVK